MKKLLLSLLAIILIIEEWLWDGCFPRLGIF